jgi:hypothetical protein
LKLLRKIKITELLDILAKNKIIQDLKDEIELLKSTNAILINEVDEMRGNLVVAISGLADVLNAVFEYTNDKMYMRAAEAVKLKIQELENDKC